MVKIREIHIPSDSNIFKHIADALLSYHTKAVGSYLFIVEGTLAKPRIGIRYPGYKLKQRTLKKPNKNSALWANLLILKLSLSKKAKRAVQFVLLMRIY